MRPPTQQPEIRTWDPLDTFLPRLRYQGPLRRHVDIAEHYGFQLIEPLRIQKEDRVDFGRTTPAERIALLRLFLERGLDTHAQPTQIAYTHKVPRRQTLQFRLDMLGSEHSVAEALIIQTTLSILHDLGNENLYVSINSIGGVESRETFVKEVTDYYKKHLDTIDAGCREVFKVDCFEPLRCTNKVCRDLRMQAPQSIGFLSEASRRHFSQIVEFLDMQSIPYRIENHLVGNPYYTVQTIFEIRQSIDHEGPDEQEDPLLAYGERYDLLSKKAGLGRIIPAVGVAIETNGGASREQFREVKQLRRTLPNAFLVHLGIDAKRCALRVLEDLRRAGVGIEAAMAEDSITRQLAQAEYRGIPVVIIIGQKEIYDGTVLVRNRNTNSQEVVAQRDLPDFLKRFAVAS